MASVPCSCIFQWLLKARLIWLAPRVVCRKFTSQCFERAGIGAIEGTHLLKGRGFPFGRLGRFPHLDEIHSLLKGCCCEVQIPCWYLLNPVVLWFCFRGDVWWFGPARLICAWCTARWRIEFIAWRRLSQSSEGLKVALGGIGSLFRRLHFVF